MNWRQTGWVCLSALGYGCGNGAPPSDSPPAPSVRHVQELQELSVSLQPMVTVAEPPGVRVPVVDCVEVKATGYRRGKKFPIKVVTIDGRYVEIATATAYWAMQLAAAEDGVALPIYSAFRSHEEQQYFRRCFKTCSCNSCSPAAKPGFSNHQSGRAIDFGQWEGVVPWLKTNAKRFGFRATVPKEPWHWEYRPRRNKRRGLAWPDVCE